MKRSLVIGVIGLLVVSIGLVCWAGGSLRSTFAWPTYADPAVGSDYSSSSTLVNLYDSLVYPTLEGSVKPDVAESWDASPDGLTWTFYLRSGVKFHDGTELTAEDVAFSMDRLTTIGEGYGYLFIGRVASTEAVDKYTVRFHMAETFGPFLTNLVRLYILNKDLVMANLEDGPYDDFGDYGKKYLLTHDAGSGAYTIKEFPLEEYVLMEKYPDYWGEIDPDAPDEVKFIATTEAMTVRTLMANKELEISDQWQTAEGFATLDRMEGVDIARFYMGGVFFYMIHTKRVPTDCIHFRKAMAWAVDYETAAALDESHPAHGPVSVDFPGWNPDVFTYHQDLDKACQELALSKYATSDVLDCIEVCCGDDGCTTAQERICYRECWDKIGLEVDVHWCAEVPTEEKVALLFQANMAEIGIKVNVIRTPWMTMIDEMADMEASPNIETIYVAPHYPEAGSMLESRYHSDSAATWEQNEWLLDWIFDAAIKDAVATIDIETRFAKYRDLQDYIVALCPSIYLNDQLERHAYQSYIDWPAAKGNVIKVMGYNMDARFIKVLPH